MHVVVSVVAEIVPIRRKERYGLVIERLADVDPTKHAASDRVAIGITGLLPPGKTLLQKRGRAVRLAAHIGEHPPASKCPRPLPRRIVIHGRLERLIEPAPRFVEMAAVVPEHGKGTSQA